jgi:sugar lactone lactonase YvrE
VVVLAAGLIVSGVRIATWGSRSAAAEVDIGLRGKALQIATGLDSVWVLTCVQRCAGRAEASSGQVIRIDARSGRILARIAVADPHAFAIGAGAIWVAQFWRGAVSRLDIDTGRTTRTIPLSLPKPFPRHDRQFLPSSIAVGGGSVWVATARGWLARLDPHTGRVVSMTPVPADVAGPLVGGAHAVWFAASVLGVGRVGYRDVRIRIRALPATSGGGRIAVDQLALGGGRVWTFGEDATRAGDAPTGTNLTLSNTARIAALDEPTGRLRAVRPFPDGPYSIAYANGALFAADSRGGRLLRVDTKTYRIRKLAHLRGPGVLLAATSDAIWATTRGGTLRRIPSGGSGNHRYPATARQREYSEWTAYVDSGAGFTVRYPPGWHLAHHPVLPGLFDPRERLAVATYALRRWPEPCVGRWPGRPGNLDLGPRDAFLTVQERGRNPAYSWTDFPGRPTHFTLQQATPAAEVGCATQTGAVARLINFTDSGRHFDAIVILGRAVSANTRRDALRVLDSLRFSPNTVPTWPASR